MRGKEVEDEEVSDGDDHDNDDDGPGNAIQGAVQSGRSFVGKREVPH